MNIIKCIVDQLNDLSTIFLSIVTGVSIIRGIGYLKSYKDRKNAATFTFWSQLRMRLIKLFNWLDNDHSLLDNLYPEDLRNSWESNLQAEAERVAEFKKGVQETIQYIESTSDQMPVYIGWTEDYNKLIEFLYDIIQYDICNPNKYFKFKENKSLRDREQYCVFMCELIKKMCAQIEQKQKDIERHII